MPRPPEPLAPLDPKKLELIDKLVRLALDNPNAEEARSAAVKACQLIREQRILERFTQPTIVTRSAVNSYTSGFDDMLRDLQQNAERARAAAAQAQANARSYRRSMTPEEIRDYMRKLGIDV